MATASATPHRRSTTEKLARRKRATIACQFCRLRKTKCDGNRPVCGYCRYHDAQCVWSVGESDSHEGTPMEHEILRRLDELKSILDESSSRQNAETTAGQALPSITTALQDLPHSPTTVASHNSVVSSGANTTSPYPYTRCESILHWPVFQGLVAPSDLDVDSYVLEADASPIPGVQGTSPLNLTSGRRGIQEDMFVPLCRKFLTHVHPRNPILEGGQLIQYAKNTAEHGLEWDGPSCLVLIACALACYTSPWGADAHEPYNAQAVMEDLDESAAEAYFLAAKKRIGLLGSSLIDIQCLFFASVFEKYALNPLQAWFYVQQASTRLQAYLRRHSKSQSRMPHSDHAKQTPNSHLEQRLFWSVFKAEHELLPELPFNSSGIEELTRADSMFPSPPAIDHELDAHEPTSPGEQYEWQEQRSWFFYLAEISLRRTINDTLWLLYRKGETYWLNHINSLVLHHEESERQIRLWYSHLPDEISFNPLEQPDNELSFYLQGRFFEWRFYTLQPLLYYVLHRSESQSMTPQLLSYAQECLYISANTINYSSRHHRHGGTWMVCRRSFSSSLVILGVAIKNILDLPPPANWEELVFITISTLSRWQSQSADIRAMRATLERLLTSAQEQAREP